MNEISPGGERRSVLARSLYKIFSPMRRALASAVHRRKHGDCPLCDWTGPDRWSGVLADADAQAHVTEFHWGEE